MDFNSGPFARYILYAIYMWYITLPVGLLLLWAGLRRSNSSPVRWVSAIVAVPLLFPFVLLLWEIITGTISDEKDSSAYRRKEKAHTLILKQPEIVSGIALSAGDTVFYNVDFNMSSRQQAKLADIGWVHLSKPTRFFNLEVTRMEQNQYGEWNIALGHDQLVHGWPCSGNVVIAMDSTFVSGTLAAEHVVWGYRAPKGAKIRYEKGYGLLRIEHSDTVLVTIDEKTKQAVVD